MNRKLLLFILSVAYVIGTSYSKQTMSEDQQSPDDLYSKEINKLLSEAREIQNSLKAQDLQLFSAQTFVEIEQAKEDFIKIIKNAHKIIDGLSRCSTNLENSDKNDSSSYLRERYYLIRTIKRSLADAIYVHFTDWSSKVDSMFENSNINAALIKNVLRKTNEMRKRDITDAYKALVLLDSQLTLISIVDCIGLLYVKIKNILSKTDDRFESRYDKSKKVLQSAVKKQSEIAQTFRDAINDFLFFFNSLAEKFQGRLDDLYSSIKNPSLSLTFITFKHTSVYRATRKLSKLLVAFNGFKTKITLNESERSSFNMIRATLTIAIYNLILVHHCLLAYSNKHPEHKLHLQCDITALSPLNFAAIKEQIQTQISEEILEEAIKTPKNIKACISKHLILESSSVLFKGKDELKKPCATDELTKLVLDIAEAQKEKNALADKR